MRDTSDLSKERNNYNKIANEYLQLLLQIKRKEAIKLVVSAVENGLPLRRVYLEIIQPVMYEVGRLWQLNTIDTAEEHYCSASTQLLIAQLFPYALHEGTSEKSMIGCCLGSELHELGMRIVCDFFELEGWDTFFTGAITPNQALIGQLKKQKPDLICISCTMHFGVFQAQQLIQEIKHCPELHRVKILVGGLSFIMSPDLYKTVGADAMAKDAQGAVEEAYKIV